MPNMPNTECIARIRRKPMDNVRWCVHNKCQQVDLRQYWVVFLPIFPASPGLPPGTQVPVPGSPGLRPGTPVPVYPSPGVRPALPRPSPIQSQPLAGASGPSPGLRPSDWRPVSVRSGTVCGLAPPSPRPFPATTTTTRRNRQPPPAPLAWEGSTRGAPAWGPGPPTPATRRSGRDGERPHGDPAGRRTSARPPLALGARRRVSRLA